MKDAKPTNEKGSSLCRDFRQKRTQTDEKSLGECFDSHTKSGLRYAYARHCYDTPSFSKQWHSHVGSSYELHFCFETNSLRIPTGFPFLVSMLERFWFPY